MRRTIAVPPATAMGEPDAPIEEHRLIGDGATAALVRPDATIDWWCAPAIHGDPLLWSLLDPTGGVACFPGAESVSFRPDPAGPCAASVVRIGGDEIEVVDALVPTVVGGSALVRLVWSLARPVSVRHLTRLGGFDRARVDRRGGGFVVGGLTWQVHGGSMIEDGGDGLVTEIRADQDGTVLVLTADPHLDLDPASLRRLVDSVGAARRAPIEAGALTAFHPERACDALAVMRACTFDRTGGIIASPTTSLPEAPGFQRQWDYRYCWLRDGSLAAAVAASTGQLELARQYLGFIERIGADAILTSPVFTVDGEHVPEEREVAGVAGWAGSLPVRVGNAASEQVQYDALGFLVEAISIAVDRGAELTAALWEVVRVVADRVAERGSEATSGIWEMREVRQFVDGDIGRWMALDHAVRLCAHRDCPAPDAWLAARSTAADRVRGAVQPDGLLPQEHPGGDREVRADASALLAVICGLLPADDPVAGGVVDAVITRLGVGPYLYRYPPGNDDGFEGVEGVFLPASWWAITALATLGRLDEAEARADALCAALPRLLPEELDPDTGRGLGNVPLVWSHIEALRALNAVSTARE